MAGWTGRREERRVWDHDLSSHVLIRIQLLLSHIALSQCKHTLVQQNVFQCMFVCAKCWYFLWTQTQGKHFYCLKTAFIRRVPFLSQRWPGLNRMMTMGKSPHQSHRWLFYVTWRSVSYPEDGKTQQEHREAPMAETRTASNEKVSYNKVKLKKRGEIILQSSSFL